MITIRDVIRATVANYSTKIAEIKQTPQLRKSPLWDEYKAHKRKVSEWLTLSQLCKKADSSLYAKPLSHGLTEDQVQGQWRNLQDQSMVLALSKDPEIFHWLTVLQSREVASV